jgi:hypothetical protein
MSCECSAGNVEGVSANPHAIRDSERNVEGLYLLVCHPETRTTAEPELP